MKKWYYGSYGGKYIPEILVPAISRLEKKFFELKKDKNFNRKFFELLKTYIGRPTPLYYAENLSKKICGSNRIYLKREDLCHTGSHKINNAIGQALLAREIGKKEIVAETGAGQHGVATATACALLGLKCKVFMGALDVERQQPNVKRMKILGAEVIPVESGNQTLKDAVNEALKYWVTYHKTTHYILGSVVGPYPFPEIVAHFQSVIGNETLNQFKKITKKKPDTVIACVGGGSNSIGMFRRFLKKDCSGIKLIGVEAAGKGLNSGQHSATLIKGKPGVLHGTFSYLLQDENGQVIEPYSISAGLDYPGVGPEHSYLKDSGLVEYVSITDKEAVNAFHTLCSAEGIIPALESSHALAYCIKYSNKHKNKNIIVNLSGRGDKDLDNLKL